MASWKKGSFEIPALKPIESLHSGIDDVLGFLEPIAGSLATALRAIALFQDRSDATATLVREALEHLLDTLDDFIEPAAGHVLFVPPMTPYQQPPRRPQVPVRQLADLAYAVRTVRGAADDLLGDGGNYGLYRRFMESLFDEGDFSRPQYRSDAYVGGGIVVFGASSFPEILKGMLALGDLFGNRLPIAADNYALPVPQNVKARPIAVPSHDVVSDYKVLSASALGGTATSDTPDFVPVLQEPELPGDYGVRISWDAPTLVSYDVSFGPFVYRIRKWHVYVKPDAKIVSGDFLFDYEVGSLGLPVAGASEQVLNTTFEANVVGNVSGCILTDLDPSVSYYVAVGYTTEIVNPADDSSTMIPPSFETLSGQARVNLSEQAPYRKIMDGAPPDWMAVSNPLQLLPDVQKTLSEAKSLGKLAISNYADYQNEANALADQVEDALQTLVNASDSLGESLGRVTRLFNGLEMGVWAATFSGQGGLPFLMNSVGTLLLDESVENRPPFDNGDEALAALVFVTGSETAAGVEGFINALEILLGTDTEDDFFVINDIDRTSDDTPDLVPLDEGANPVAPGFGVNETEDEAPTLGDLEITDDDPC